MKHIILIFTLLFLSKLPASENVERKTSAPQKHHILYLTRSNKLNKVVDLYQEYKKVLGKHDPEILSQMSFILLEQGIKKTKLEPQLVALYGASLADVEILLDLCESGARSEHPSTQVVSIQLASQIQDERADKLLIDALYSPYLGIRMEAAFGLCAKKHRSAIGHAESLMAKLPPVFKGFFTEMFAMSGSAEGDRILKKIMHDKLLNNRTAAFLAAAKYQRDDFISDLRIAASHKNPSEQEASVSALGFLKDSASEELLNELSKNEDEEVRLSALRSLLFLGKTDVIKEIEQLAEDGNLFAIQTLGQFPEKSSVLPALTKSKDKTIMYNAALSLLSQKDKKCLPVIKTMLSAQKLDIGYLPFFSKGRSFYYFKPIYSLSIHAKKQKNPELVAQALALSYRVLEQCLELDEDSFLDIANYVFSQNLKTLVPHTIKLLCNLSTDKAKKFLSENSEKVGSPLIRHFCHLGLYQINGSKYSYDKLVEWIKSHYKTEMIRFNPVLSKTNTEANLRFDLTPEESSALLIESYMRIIDKQTDEGIDLLLDGLKNGHDNNTGLLAGLLLKAIE